MAGRILAPVFGGYVDRVARPPVPRAHRRRHPRAAGRLWRVVPGELPAIPSTAPGTADRTAEGVRSTAGLHRPHGRVHPPLQSRPAGAGGARPPDKTRPVGTAGAARGRPADPP